MKEAIAKISRLGIVQVLPYGLYHPPPVMHFLGVLIQDTHNLPVLFVFPEVCGWQRLLVVEDTEGQRAREGK